MPLSVNDRAAFLALLSHLGPDEDADPVMAFVRDHWKEVLEEVAADPGMDQVRAGLIRALRPLRSDPDVASALEAAARVIHDYPEHVAEAGHTLLLSRHPAWVGLAALELFGGPDVAPDKAVDLAVSLASAGFAEVAGKGEVAPGEALWAMAEQADEVGWRDHGRQLLRRAAEASFANPEHAAQVRFLYAMRLAEDEDDAADERLEEVVADPHSDARTRTHAAWILARRREAMGDMSGARSWLRTALDGVDPDDDPTVADRIATHLRDLA